MMQEKNSYCDYWSVGKDFGRLRRKYNGIQVQWQYINKEIRADIFLCGEDRKTQLN